MGKYTLKSSTELKWMMYYSIDSSTQCFFQYSIHSIHHQRVYWKLLTVPLLNAFKLDSMHKCHKHSALNSYLSKRVSSETNFIIYAFEYFFLWFIPNFTK